jgi:GNAT superfamily N-acetyltransferase
MYIKVEYHPKESDKEELSNNLYLSNVKKGMPERTICWVLMKDNEENLIGGSTFYLFEEFVYVDQLWVHEEYQGQGLGQKILQAVENEAREKGALASHLDTFSFQNAKAFYEKCGYHETSRHDSINGKHIRYFMMKSLTDKEKY